MAAPEDIRILAASNKANQLIERIRKTYRITGGLDSLLEPTGNIKKAQEKAARAFGADRVFFVTNGSSTSNKMAVQALIGPGDIVIVDRTDTNHITTAWCWPARSRFMSKPSR